MAQQGLPWLRVQGTHNTHTGARGADFGDGIYKPDGSFNGKARYVHITNPRQEILWITSGSAAWHVTTDRSAPGHHNYLWTYACKGRAPHEYPNTAKWHQPSRGTVTMLTDGEMSVWGATLIQSTQYAVRSKLKAQPLIVRVKGSELDETLVLKDWSKSSDLAWDLVNHLERAHPKLDVYVADEVTLMVAGAVIKGHGDIQEHLIDPVIAACTPSSTKEPVVELQCEAQVKERVSPSRLAVFAAMHSSLCVLHAVPTSGACV